MKQLIIFDLDGTLVDTLTDLAIATNKSLVEMGFPEHAVDDYRMFVGNGVSKLFERALPAEGRSEDNIARLRNLFTPYYDAHLTTHSRPYEGIPELLCKLRDEGYLLAVASNKYQSATERIVATLFPDIPFKPVLGQREGVPRKPDPHIVHEILSATGMACTEALYIGDSGVDMQTAINAKVTACAVLWGFRDKDELEAYSPKYTAREAKDIYEAILNEN